MSVTYQPINTSHPRFKDLTGERFGKLTVKGPLGRRGLIKETYWLCECECGALSEVKSSRLKAGLTSSCGCVLGLETHGMSTKPIYKIWTTMHQRCSNPKRKDFHYYGGRGITVCGRWQSFENFYQDMGDRPEGKSLDRIDNSKGYSPENCKWSTREEQIHNRRPRRDSK